MPSQTTAITFSGPHAEPKIGTITRRDLRDDDVSIDIAYAGICHTDVHIVNSDWNQEVYPVVPGHEIIGLVKEVGPKVTKFKVGDKVGVGCLVDSCQSCSQCARSHENYCDNAVQTYQGIDRHDGTRTFGGYSKFVIVSENFVLSIPESLYKPDAAPLLCAGITTYSPLKKWNCGPGKKVGVIGLGGLGHMALKFAKALGAETALFSRSTSKAAEAEKLGVDEIIISTDENQLNAAAGKFDIIIDTVPYDHDVNPYINTLSSDGALVIVGFVGASEQSKFITLPLVFRGKVVTGSLIGGIKETQEMLEFSEKHNIVSDIEIIKADYIGEAYQRVLKSDVKYRFVIDNSTF